MTAEQFGSAGGGGQPALTSPAADRERIPLASTAGQLIDAAVGPALRLHGVAGVEEEVLLRVNLGPPAGLTIGALPAVRTQAAGDA